VKSGALDRLNRQALVLPIDTAAPMSAHANNPSSGPRGSATPLPILEIRFTATYAWLLIGAGAIFFVLSFLVGSKNGGLGIFIAILSVGAIFGGNYWRHHLPVVARMTPRQLILKRRGTVSWSDIVAIDKKTIRLPHKGVTHENVYVCIKLRAPLEAPDKLHALFDKLKKAALGYDIIIPDAELSYSADSFIAECRKRMVGSTGAAA
jgi:hypothetical protein